MATLSIEASREFLIFQAFAKSDSYDKVLSVLETYDKQNPDRRFFSNPKSKLALRESYKEFRNAEKKLDRTGNGLDYDDIVTVRRLQNVLQQSLPPVSRGTILSDTQGLGMMKASIGAMMEGHAKNIMALGKQALRKDDRIHHQVENTRSFGGIKRVAPKQEQISNNYKTNGQRIAQKIFEERINGK